MVQQVNCAMNIYTQDDLAKILLTCAITRSKGRAKQTWINILDDYAK
jgi:hypothetical protein